MRNDDESAIDRIVTDFYAAFDNRDGRVPDIERLRELFTGNATITHASSIALDNWSFDEFAEPRAALLTDGSLTNFHEWETTGETVLGALIASRRSVYEKAGMAGDKPYGGGGRKFIQLCKSETGWRIASILWEDTDR